MTDEMKPVKCGCGGEARLGNADYMCVAVYCMDCGTRTKPFNVPAEAIRAWNRAMGAKDINVPDKFATDKNVGDKERTAKVEVHSHPCGVSGKCCACGGDVYNGDPYCSHCGAKLDWSE